MKKQEAAMWVIIAGILSFPIYNTFDTYVLHRGDTQYAENKSAAERDARVQQELKIRKNCAAAREKHDKLYKAGVANVNEQVDVRAACEPAKVEAETATKWLLIALAIGAALVMVPLLTWGLAPG